jgi:acyl-coenzyme A thioesterase PaaI-like protein
VSTETPIEVPWRTLPGYRCFGCSPVNDRGLQLTFTDVGDGIETRLLFDRAYESYPGVVHGGILTTVCDEIMGNLLVLRVGRSLFTTTLRTRYLSPLAVGTPYRCVATTGATGEDAPLYRAHAEIVDHDGRVLVTAAGTYHSISDEQSRARMALSDEDAELVERALAGIRQAGT